MRLTPPEGFRANEFYQGIFTFQEWEVFPGHLVTGRKPVNKHLSAFGAGARFDGKRVLDIAPWNGFFGFEMLRRGARELVAIGPEDPHVTGFAQTAALLEIEDRTRYVRDSIYNMKRHDVGGFDVVLCLGLMYHLRHPLLALDLIHDHCIDDASLFIDSAVIDTVHAVADESKSEALQPSWAKVSSLPLSIYLRGGSDAPTARDTFNWFMPNAACLRAWVVSSGFRIEHERAAPEWQWIRARVTERPFTPDFEGFNARVGSSKASSAGKPDTAPTNMP